MEGAARSLLQAASNAQGDTTAPFFGFMGAASALVFACANLTPSRTSVHRASLLTLDAPDSPSCPIAATLAPSLVIRVPNGRSAVLCASQASALRTAQPRQESASHPWACCDQSW